MTLAAVCCGVDAESVAKYGRRMFRAAAVSLTVAAVLGGGAGSAVAASSDGQQPSCGAAPGQPGSMFNTYSQTISSANPRDYYRLGEQPGGGAITNGTVVHAQTGNSDGAYRGNAVG